MITSLLVVRHASRLDAVDHQWVENSPTPYDTPLSENGFNEAEKLSKEIVNLVHDAQDSYRKHLNIISDSNPSSSSNSNSNSSFNLSEKSNLNDTLYKEKNSLDNAFSGNNESNDENFDNLKNRNNIDNDKNKVSLFSDSSQVPLVKRLNIIVHSSPFLRCVQTGYKICSALIDYKNKIENENDPDNEEKPSFPISVSMKMDSVLGEWQTLDYYSGITPPPEDDHMSLVFSSRGWIKMQKNSSVLDNFWNPLKMGHAGSYGEEWFTMHNRACDGLKNIVSYYNENNNSDSTLSNSNGNPNGEEENVIIIVSHGALCNALIGGLTGKPVLREIPLCSITIARPLIKPSNRIIASNFNLISNSRNISYNSNNNSNSSKSRAIIGKWKVVLIADTSFLIQSNEVKHLPLTFSPSFLWNPKSRIPSSDNSLSSSTRSSRRSSFSLKSPPMLSLDAAPSQNQFQGSDNINDDVSNSTLAAARKMKNLALSPLIQPNVKKEKPKSSEERKTDSYNNDIPFISTPSLWRSPKSK